MALMPPRAMAATALRPAIFLDKDGTLVENLPYNVDPALIRLAPGAGEALARWHEAGYALVVISNQAGVALGHFAEDALLAVEARLAALFAACGARLAGLYCCPHHPDGVVAQYTRWCMCRKPAPGLIHRAASEHGIELARSWMIGDILDDIEAGRRAGCRSILLDNGNETEWRYNALRVPHFMASDLAGAAGIVLTEDAAHPVRETETLASREAA